jgi:hypothetical protein
MRAVFSANACSRNCCWCTASCRSASILRSSASTLGRQAQLVGFAVGLHLLAHKLALFHRINAVLNLHAQCVAVFADGGDVSL